MTDHLCKITEVLHEMTDHLCKIINVLCEFTVLVYPFNSKQIHPSEILKTIYLKIYHGFILVFFDGFFMIWI